MKKLKFLTLAAIAAATAMVSSCSDNVELSTPTKEAEGKALVVNPTVLDSRVTPLAKSAFRGFKLYGVQNPTNGESVGSFIKTEENSGVNYAGTFGSSDAEVSFAPASGTVKWPTTNPDNSANFYGISVHGGSDLTGSGITVTEDGITEGTFSYTAPVDGEGNVDLSKQKDIMIASSLNAKQSTDNGVVTLPFKHAFAKLTFQIRWNSSEYILGHPGSPAGAIEDNAALLIDYIKFHNIKCNGTYDFTADDGNGGKGKWTVDGENSTITFKYTTPMSFSAQKYTFLDEYLEAHPGLDENDPEVVAACNANPFKVQDLMVGDKAIMIIPQDLGLWKNAATSGWFSTNTTGAFVEVHCLAYKLSGDDSYDSSVPYWDDVDNEDYNYTSIISGDDEHYFASVYFPIRIDSSTPFTFEGNKSYNFRLNFATCRQDDGTSPIEGVTITD